MLSNEELAQELAVAAAKIMLENRVRISPGSDTIEDQISAMARVYKITYNQLLKQLTD